MNDIKLVAIKTNAAHAMMGDEQVKVVDAINMVSLEAANILDELSICDWSQAAGRIENLQRLLQAAAMSMAAIDTINSIVDPE